MAVNTTMTNGKRKIAATIVKTMYRAQRSHVFNCVIQRTPLLPNDET